MEVLFFDDKLEKDETKTYYLDKKVSTPDTLFLYYKSIEKSKEELEKEELLKIISELKEKLEATQEALDFIIELNAMEGE